MPFSYTTIPADGSTNTFAVPFPYISTSHVSIKVNGVATTFTFPTSATVTLTDTAASLTGKTVEIRRTTPRVARLVDFQDAANLTEASLDLSANQQFYVMQEVLDDNSVKLTLGADDSFDALGKKIKNLANGTSSQDAVTVAQLNGVAAGLPGSVVTPFMATALDDATSNDLLTTVTATRAEAGAAAVTVLTKLRERVSVDDFSGATFAIRAAAALASGAKEILVIGNQTLTATLTIPANVTVRGIGKPTITKGANIDMFDMTAQGCQLQDMRLEGAGATYTGRGLIFTNSSLRYQAVQNVDIYDMSGYAVEFTVADAGGTSNFSNCTFRRTTLTNPAVKLPGGAQEPGGNRSFIGCRSDGGTLMDLASSSSTIINACNFVTVLFGTVGAKAVITGNRIATLGGTVTIEGQDHCISGNVVAGNISLGTSTQRVVIGPNTLLDNATVTDNSTASGNDINDVYNTQNQDIQPVWQGTTTNPVIGNGTLSGSIYRNGRLLRATIYMVVGSTTTFGTGTWYFTIPSPFAAFVARKDCIGSVYMLDNGTAHHIGVCKMVVGSGQIVPYAVTGGDVSPTVPMTWAVNDTLRLTIDFEMA